MWKITANEIIDILFLSSGISPIINVLFEDDYKSSFASNKTIVSNPDLSLRSIDLSGRVNKYTMIFYNIDTKNKSFL